MDPIIEGAEYGILRLLQQAYGEDKAAEYVQLWNESLVSPQVGYEVIQAP